MRVYLELKAQKHWFLRTNPKPLSKDILDKVDEVFRNRWRTLLSVDDMVDTVMKQLERMDLLRNTFVIFTSDHGYHLGTFALTIDKRFPMVVTNSLDHFYYWFILLA